MKKIYKILIYIAIIFLAAQYISYNNFKSFYLENDLKVSIKEWTSPRTALIKNFWLKKIHLQISWYDKKITNLQVWSYVFQKWNTLDDIVRIFNKWPNIYDIDECLSKPENKKITIKNWEEVSCLNNKNKDWIIIPIFTWIINPWEYINEVKNVSKYSEKYQFLKWLETLEWFLYPDTYFITFSVEQTVSRQLDTFEKKVFKTLLSNKSQNEIYEIIKISSIVEKEEKNKLEQPTVAWILIKRYKENWMIWADITACYPYEYTENECRLNLSKHIKEKNDYNTRTMVWLPKTPINNPSYTTINNTINYKNTPYYFYLHNSISGKVYYWVTNADHESNKRFME